MKKYHKFRKIYNIKINTKIIFIFELINKILLFKII